MSIEGDTETSDFINASFISDVASQTFYTNDVFLTSASTSTMATQLQQQQGPVLLNFFLASMVVNCSIIIMQDFGHKFELVFSVDAL